MTPTTWRPGPWLSALRLSLLVSAQQATGDMLSDRGQSEAIILVLITEETLLALPPLPWPQVTGPKYLNWWSKESPVGGLAKQLKATQNLSLGV